MELEHTFTVAVPVETAWQVLLDLERIAPCMPGATLTSVTGDEFTGTVAVKLGPVTMTFAGQGRFVERDPAAHRVVVEASGKDKRGGGSARATIRAVLRGENGTTVVDVHSDLVVTGRAAQFGRGMIAEVSNRLLGQFTECLAAQLAGTGGVGDGAGAAGAAASAAGAPADGGAPAATAAGSAPPASPPAAAAVGGAAATATDQPAAAAPASRTGAAVPRQAEPIDLLAVTGVRAATARLVPYLIVFVVG